MVTKDVSISGSNPLITEKGEARTFIECITSCQDLLKCASVFYDPSGKMVEV